MNRCRNLQARTLGTAGPSARTEVLGRDDSIYFTWLTPVFLDFSEANLQVRPKLRTAGPSTRTEVLGRDDSIYFLHFMPAFLDFSEANPADHQKRRSTRSQSAKTVIPSDERSEESRDLLSCCWRDARLHLSSHSPLVHSSEDFTLPHCHPDRGLQPEWRDLL